MWPFRPKRTFESVARELADGLANGTIVLGSAAGSAPPPPGDDTADAIAHSEPEGGRPAVETTRPSGVR